VPCMPVLRRTRALIGAYQACLAGSTATARDIVSAKGTLHIIEMLRTALTYAIESGLQGTHRYGMLAPGRVASVFEQAVHHHKQQLCGDT
jgi:hypothetical protein